MSINVCLSRNASRDYQSTGVSINVAAELDSALLQKPAELQQQIAGIYAQAEFALERQANGKAPPAPAGRTDGSARTSTHANAGNGQRNGSGMRQLFHVIHRRDQMAPARFGRALEKARDELLATGKAAPQRHEAQTMAERFRRNGTAYFRFITTPQAAGIDPTNNLAEQAIRFVVIDRYITQGTRSQKGRDYCQRAWTAVATCAQQARSVYQFFGNAVTAAFNGTPIPSLLPAAP